MQLLALFLLTVNAGALPQSSQLPPSQNLAPTTAPVNSTAPHIHEKRYLEGRFQGFDDPKCQDKTTGHNMIYEWWTKCLPYTPRHKYIYVGWGDNSGQFSTFFDDKCAGPKAKTIDDAYGGGVQCLTMEDFGGKKVRAVQFPPSELLKISEGQEPEGS